MGSISGWSRKLSRPLETWIKLRLGGYLPLFAACSDPTPMQFSPAAALLLPMNIIPADVSLADMATRFWTDAENDLIVADYFAMLAADLIGRPYNKAEHNRLLRSQIERSRPSIEFKHRNVSAVLKGLGENWITGYLPAFNVQTSLADAVARWLHRHPGFEMSAPHVNKPTDSQETAQLEIELPPTVKNHPPPDELEQMQAIARKFDVAARAERNRTLGRAGEERVLAHERAVLSGVGRSDLARRVIWVSEEYGDGAGYDIESYSPDGQTRLIEVKTTNGWERTPFHITRNELVVAENRPTEWCLLRLWNFAREPRAFELRPPLLAHVALIATSYEARFH